MAFSPPPGLTSMLPWDPFHSPSYHYVDPELANPYCNYIVACVVCGGICIPTVPSALPMGVQERSWMHPWLLKADEGFVEWRADPRNARHPYDQELDPLRLFEVAEFRGGASGFKLRGGGSATINTYDLEMYIPIHRACLGLAKKYCQVRPKSPKSNFRDFSQDGNGGGIPSRIGHFYEIWMQQVLISNNYNYGVLGLPICGPARYFSYGFTSNLKVYNSFLHWCRPALPIEHANPSGNRAATTQVVLNHLVRLDNNTSMTTPTSQALQNGIEHILPLELNNMIIRMIKPFCNLEREHLRCTRVLPSYWWMDELLSGKLIPWLFDLDRGYLDIVEQKFKGERPNQPFNIENDLDWELLCRQLAQKDPFDLGGVLCGENRLANRWRIWRLLDFAHLNPNIPV
ncbi:hypothetical protein F4814DRAFT_452133 [Daldinia grandis]|nr:hypothetical protein F4814DRAFT_452133 [Daldinia grandis]